MLTTEIQNSTLLGDRYALTAEIGAGRIGSVFGAFDIQNRNKVIVKMISPIFVPGAKSFDYLLAMLEERLHLQHSNITRLLNIGVWETLAAPPAIYYVSEYIPGQTLHERIAQLSERPFSIGEILSYLLQIADALSYLHAENISFGDLHPKRILLTEDDVIKLPPFGFVSSSQWLRDASQHGVATAVDYRYLAPEMIMGNSVSEGECPSDVYLLGLLAFELACGTVPFDANRETIIQLHKHEPLPETLQRSQLPKWYEELVRACTKKLPQNRPSIGEIKKILIEKLSHPTAELSQHPHYVQQNGVQVLFVEDNRLDQLSFARFAKNNSYPFSYKIARSVENAREMLNSRQVDVVVSDFMLPDGTGVDVVGAAAGIPTIILTGAGREDVAALALRAGAFDYLSKDMRYEHLTMLPQVVQRAVEWAKAKKEREDLNRRIRELEKLRLSTLVQSFTLEKLAESLEATQGRLQEARAQLGSLVDVGQLLDELEHNVASCTLLVNQSAPPRNAIAGGDTEADSNVCEVINGIVSFLRSDSDLCHIDFEVLCQGQEQARASIPASWLELALLNLCENSRDAIGFRAGKVVFRVSCRTVEGTHQTGDPGARVLCVSVEDSGAGIDPAVVERMFVPFVSTRDRGKHLGIGLSIVRRIVEECGGQVLAGGSASSGARFTLCFPLKEQSNSLGDE